MATLTGANGNYYSNGWYVSNNSWGSSGLTYGTDYTISGTYDPSNLTANLSYTWNFGALPNNGVYTDILAYPELCYGQNAWSTTIASAEAPFPLKLSDITTLKTTYNVSYGGQTAGYDVAFDMFFTSNPTGGSSAITNEVMIWIHTGGFTPGTPIATYSDSSFSGSIYSFPMSSNGLTWNYSAVCENSDSTNGTIDIAAILKKLESLGIVSSSAYLENIDLGAEVAAGQGNLTINSLDYEIQTTGSADQIIGTPPATSTPDPTPTPVVPWPLSPDFNADGKADVLFQNTNGQLMVWTMNGTAELGSTTLSNPGLSWKAVAGADFNGDGKTDIALQNGYGNIQIWTMNGTAVTSAATVSANPGSAWKAITAGDFNGDGKADLVFQNTNGSVMVWLMNGATKVAGAGLGSPGKNWNVIGAGDFNGDGDSDILLQNTNGKVQIWFMNGTSVASTSTVSTNPGSSWKAVGTGDFDNDGHSDILFQNTNGQTMIWLMNGSTVESSAVVGNPGSSWHAIGAGDYNGDGTDDILFQNTNGQTMVWTMNGLTVTAQGTVGNPGSAWHAVVGG